MFSFLRKTAPAAPPLVDRIIVPEKALKDTNWQLINHLDMLWAAMGHRSYFRASELPPNLARVLLTNRYHAEVCNGGHDQFFSNVEDHWDLCLEVARDVFTSAGMRDYATCVDDLLVWTNSDEGQYYLGKYSGVELPHDPEDSESSDVRLTEVDDEMAFLKSLDDRFHKLKPLDTYYEGMNRWILSLPDIEIVPDDAYQARLAALAASIPDIAKRRDIKNIDKLLSQLRLNVQVGATLACVSATPRRRLRELHRSRPTQWYGARVTRWDLETTQGRNTMWELGDTYALFRADDPQPPKVWTRRGLLSLAEGQTTKAEIERVRAQALEQYVAHATMLLLRRSGIAGQVDRIGYDHDHWPSDLGSPTGAYVIDLETGGTLTILSGPNGARLLADPDSRTLAQATAAEIEDAARAWKPWREFSDD